MSQLDTDIHAPDSTTAAGNNAAKRHAKGLARQRKAALRKAAQRQVALDQARDRHRPRPDAAPGPADPVVEVPVVEAAVGVGELVVEEPVVKEDPEDVDLVVEETDLEEDAEADDALCDDFLFGPARAEDDSDDPEVGVPDRPRHGRRRPRAALRLIGCLVVLAVGGTLAWQTIFARSALVSLEATGPDASEVLVVGTGTIDLAGLASEAERLGRPEALQRLGGDTYLLTMPTTVGTGGHLALAGTELRLLSQPGNFAGLEARGGSLTLRDAVVTSWDPATGAPDTDVADGRAYLLARDGGRLDVVGSSVSRLGYDAYERYGVSWRTAGTEGVIERSTFSGNFYGAYMNGVEPMKITDSVIEDSISYGLDPHSGSRDFTIVGNTFRNNGKHGMILAEDCTGAEVRDNDAYGNREHGIVVFARSDDAVVTGNRVRENGGAGISVNDSARAAVRDNDVWANTTGVTVQDGATEARIEGNRLSNNREDGVLVSSEASTATVVANRIDHNGRAGVWVNGGQATVGPDNHITNNESGVRLVDETPSVQVFDNLLSENYKDGFSLVVADGLSLTGNRIEDNEVAFSVRTAGLATPFLEVNTMIDNELGSERVREPDPEPAPAPLPVP